MSHIQCTNILLVITMYISLRFKVNVFLIPTSYYNTGLDNNTKAVVPLC